MMASTVGGSGSSKQKGGSPIVVPRQPQKRWVPQTARIRKDAKRITKDGRSALARPSEGISHLLTPEQACAKVDSWGETKKSGVYEIARTLRAEVARLEAELAKRRKPRPTDPNSLTGRLQKIVEDAAPQPVSVAQMATWTGADPVVVSALLCKLLRRRVLVRTRYGFYAKPESPTQSSGPRYKRRRTSSVL